MIKNNYIKTLIKTAAFSFLLVLICIVLATALMIAVFSIPVDHIEQNVVISSKTLFDEGGGPDLTPLCSSRLDNFTDSIMLANAAYNGNESTVNKAMTVYMNTSDNLSREEELYHYYHNPNDYEFEKEGYARYWHGYLLILKPMLLITNYNVIRIINLVVQTALNILIVWLLIKRKKGLFAIPYILSVCLIMPLATAFSMQYASVFYIFAIAMIILLCFDNFFQDKIKLYLFFTLIGICTAFFDFLTYPLATFGMVAVLYFLLRDSLPVKNTLFDIGCTFTCWLGGYGCMWSGKWVVGSLLTKTNMIREGLASVATRTSHESGRGEFPIIKAAGKNILEFIRNPLMLLAVAFIIVLVVLMIKRLSKTRLNVTAAIPFAIILILPVLWYLLAANHSFVHYKITYRTLIVTAFAGLCMITKVYESLRNKSK